MLFTPVLTYAQDAKAPAGQVFGFKDDSQLWGQELSQNPFARNAQPHHWAGLEIYTSLQGDLEINNNIRATQDHQQADVIGIIAPHISAQRAFGRHHFNLTLQGTRRQYNQETDENTSDYGAELALMLEPMRSIKLPIKLTYNKGHIARDRQRGETLQTLTIKPLEYSQHKAEAGLRYQPNRLYGQVSASYAQARYENGLRGNGQRLMQEDQDHDTTSYEAKIGYETKTSFHPFILARLNQENFKKRRFVSGAGFTGDDRSNEVMLARAGVEFDYKGLIWGSLAAGQERRNYKQSGIQDTTSLSLNQQMNWSPSPRYVFALRSLISTAEDTITKAAIKKRGALFSLGYEVKQDLFAHLETSYAQDEFVAQSRTDETWKLGAELRYTASPRLQLGLGYGLIARESDAANGDMDNQIFMLRAIGNL